MTALTHVAIIWILGNMAILALVLCPYPDAARTSPKRQMQQDVRRSEGTA